MQVIKYNLCTRVRVTRVDPVSEKVFEQNEEILSPVTMGWNEANEEIAKREAYNGEYTIEDVPDPPMTAEEARAQRKKLLLDTDWTQALDAPISAECREAFRVYRQALRDITEQEGFPESIEWPVAPQVIKAAPDPVDTAVDVLLGGDEA